MLSCTRFSRSKRHNHVNLYLLNIIQRIYADVRMHAKQSSECSGYISVNCKHESSFSSSKTYQRACVCSFLWRAAQWSGLCATYTNVIRNVCKHERACGATRGHHDLHAHSFIIRLGSVDAADGSSGYNTCLLRLCVSGFQESKCLGRHHYRHQLPLQLSSSSTSLSSLTQRTSSLARLVRVIMMIITMYTLN